MLRPDASSHSSHSRHASVVGEGIPQPDLSHLGIRVILGLYWGYIGVILGLYWGYIGVMLGLCWGYIGIMEKKMETTTAASGS